MDRETIIQNSTVPSENISHDLSEAMEAGLEAISNTTELPEDMQFKSANGGFQLLDLIVTELKSHMTC